MEICKVTGTVVAPEKHPAFRRAKLLVVSPVGADGMLSSGKDMLAIDPQYGAGIGDFVLVAKEGAAVAQLLGAKDIPANVVVLGVVDDWSVANDASHAPS